ncbi:hypothetical protein FHL15_003863 [Xylaria flabelliformis]|uniref:Uncharacterized protein n=1 Tax=Xylaria flabelliformis TaxID=2512241 RepID=A0A553I4Q4_9PEZI|nr:hypothetical protein FHL15_003863 [Xylaria flabelliformis]
MPPKSDASEGSEEDLKKMAEWLNSERPTLTESQIEAIRQRVIPQVGQHITASLNWSQDDIDIVNRAADQASDAQHEDMPKKLIEMEWTIEFNEALSKVLVHNAWGNEFHLMVAAIRFICICTSGDRRPWKPKAYGDPFFEAFLYCQEENPEAPKSDLLDAVERRLENQRQLPSTTFRIFQSIVSTVNKALILQRRLPEPWQLLTVRTRHLSQLLECLDKINVHGVPLFCPSETQLKIVMSAREGGIFRSKDAPTTRSDYVQLRRVALKGLRASGIAYKMAWDRENTVLQDIPRYLRPVPDTVGEDVEMSPSRRRKGSSARGRGTSSKRGAHAGDQQQGSAPTRHKRSHGETDLTKESDEDRPPVHRSKPA